MGLPSILACYQNEAQNRPPNEDQIWGSGHELPLPRLQRPLRKIRTEENAFFTEETWNCSACMKNYYKRRNTWIGTRPIFSGVD